MPRDVTLHFRDRRGVVSLRSGDVTRDDSQRRFLAQHSVAMLEQYCKHSKQCRNNVATLCCAKSRRCESSCVTEHDLYRNSAEITVCISVNRSPIRYGFRAGAQAIRY